MTGSKTFRCAALSAFLLTLAGPALAANGAMPPALGPETGIPPLDAEQLNGPAGRVDDVLSKLSSKLTGPVTDPVQDEQDFNRALNYTRQGGTMLKPVGFTEINGKRVMYVATADVQGGGGGQSGGNASLQRLEEGSSVGTFKINRVSVAGLEYTAGSKKIFAPLTLVVADPPKAPTTSKSNDQTATEATGSAGHKK